MQQLRENPKYLEVADASAKHKAESKKAIDKASEAADNRRKTINPFKKVSLWVKEKKFERKAVKEWNGRTETNSQVKKMKNDAGINPNASH